MMNTADLPLQTINGKPVFAIWTAMILGIVLLIAGWWFHGAIVLGILLCALALFVQIKGKSYTQFAFYPDYFVVFNQEDPDHCQKIARQDVQEWTIDTNHRQQRAPCFITAENKDMCFFRMINGKGGYVHAC